VQEIKKILFVIFSCLFIIPVFSQETGKLEIETGVDSSFITGYYDPDGEFVEAAGDPAMFTIFVSVAYEFFPGFEVGFKPRYQIRNEDAGDVSGFIHHLL
jgi:hypothetical protein